MEVCYFNVYFIQKLSSFEGGAFCVGGNDHRIYGPDYFIDKGIVFVAINYRLGPLGFLSLENDSISGNQVCSFLNHLSIMII